MPRRTLGIVVVIIVVLGLALLLGWRFRAAPEVAQPMSATALTPSVATFETPHAPVAINGQRQRDPTSTRNSTNPSGSTNTVAPDAALYLPVERDHARLVQRMRVIAIRQANAIALAQLPVDIERALAELHLAEAQRLLETVAKSGQLAADRLLASMGYSHQRGQPCLPYTEFIADPVPVQQIAAFDRQRHNALTVAPAEVASTLVELEPLFERSTVLAACAELTIDSDASWQRLLASAATDDESRLFLSRYEKELGFFMPERAPDDEGNQRPPYSRATEAGIASTLKSGWRQFADRAELNQRLVTAATAAEPYPALFALAGNALFDSRNPAVMNQHAERGLTYLSLAAENGDRLGLERYGTELMRYADSIEHGYLLGLFARHLNARGCYPGEFLAEWERQYRYVEETAQAMSPVTLQIIQEKAAKYIKANAARAYDHLHCRD